VQKQDRVRGARGAGRGAGSELRAAAAAGAHDLRGRGVERVPTTPRITPTTRHTSLTVAPALLAARAVPSADPPSTTTTAGRAPHPASSADATAAPIDASSSRAGITTARRGGIGGVWGAATAGHTLAGPRRSMRAAAQGASHVVSRAARLGPRRAGGMARAAPTKSVLVPVADGSEEMEVREGGMGWP